MRWWPGLLVTLAVLIVLAGKVMTIGEYAPRGLGDNSGFVVTAQQMRDGSFWTDSRVDRQVHPPSLWRPLGYSAVIAGMQSLFGDGWKLALASLQAALSLCAGLLVLRLCRASGLSWPVSTAVFLLYQWSIPLSTDALFMEDALTGALGAFAIYLGLRPVVAGQVPSLPRLLAIGCLAAVSFLIRDVYHFAMPVVAAGAFVVLLRRCGLRLAALAAVALVAPVMVMGAALKEFNHARTGYAVTTTAGQTAYVYALVMAAKYDPGLVAGDGVVEQAIRRSLVTYDYPDAKAANRLLFAENGLNSVQQAEAAGSLFWRSLFTRPYGLVRAALDRVRLVQQGTLFAGPVTRIDDLDWWSAGAVYGDFRSGWRLGMDRFLASRDLADLTPEVAANMALRVLSRAVGLVMLAMFVLGTPVLWLVLGRRLGGIAHAAMITWGLYALWVCMYIPVSFEVRYLSPMIGYALFATALVAVNGRALVTGLRRGDLGAAR